jgi:hypothetical protein
MRRNLAIAAMLLLFTLSSFAASLKDARTVYLLPMSGGLDQYLAISLTTGNVLQVVVDPQKADAVLTDHVGESFEAKLDELYGTKPKVDPSADSSQTFARVQGGIRGRGALFLVDRKTREVLWSDYEHSKDNSQGEVRKSAMKLAQKLGKALGTK